MISMRPQARLFVLSGLLIVLTFILYLNIHTPQRSRHGSVPPSPADGAALRAINTAFDDLEFLLDKPIGTFDFAAKGDRVAAFADLVTTLQDHGITNHERLNALVRKEFPWWKSNNHKNLFQDISGQAGIVVCVGSGNALFAGHLIRTLRNVLKSTLTIQIAYAGDDDLSKKDQDALLRLNTDLELLNLLDHFDESVAGLRDGKYAMKPFAVIASRFRKTVLVDADVIFLQKPETIFDLHGGIETTGSLFYHDKAYKMEGQSRAAWVRTLLNGRPPSPYLENSLFWKEDLWQEMESGVVAFDKGHSRILMTLLFSAWMNTKEVREKETYSHVLGDKETYWLACELSNTPYYFQPDYAGSIGTLEPAQGNPATSKICSAHILHMDHTGEMPFWFNGGLLLNKALPGNDLVTLTHYITGGATWADQPAWRYNGNEYWCAEGKPATALTHTKMEVVVDQIMQEARMVQGALGV
jgi:hypothetical protein